MIAGRRNRYGAGLMTASLSVVGGLLVLLALVDIFYSVLFPSSGRGPLRKPVTRMVWRSFRAATRMVPARRRQRLLTYSGPVVITATMLAWGAVLVIGWALIAQPALGRGITDSAGPTHRGWAAAFYYSASVLTTLGPGTLGPTSAVYRMLQVSEAAIGLVGLTMVITYFLSVYGAVTARKTFASALHLRTRGTADAAELLIALSTEGHLSDTRGYLTDIGDSLLEMLQTHRSYPVLRYFHFHQTRYSLPRILLIALDAVTLLQAALGPQGAARVVSAATVTELHDGAIDLLGELTGKRPASSTTADRRRWRARYHGALERMRAAGVELPAQAEAAADHYVRMRQSWEPALRALAADTLYPWERVDPAVDAGTDADG